MAVIQKMNKKSMIFTVFAILLVAVLIANVSLLSRTDYMQKSFVTSSRVTTMNDFILSVHQDAQRNLMISGYRAIITLQRYIAVNGVFVTNFSDVFQELVVNGSINGVKEDIMENASINDWAFRMNNEAEKLNINVYITPRNVRVYHKTPWKITIELNATMNITDFNNLACWKYDKVFQKEVDIISFEDPIYTVRSYNKVTNIISRANNTNFVNKTNNDTSVLYLALNNSYYIESSNAPDFISRFSGNFSASQYGITSLVDLLDFSRQNIELLDRSVIDYQYFNTS